MDHERAIEVLEWWVTKAERARSIYQGKPQAYASANSPGVLELREREDQTRRVLMAVNGYDSLPVLIRPWSGGDNVDLGEGIVKCRYALGRLRTDAETRLVLGPSSPTMAADGLHPTIWTAASSLWNDKHYRAAVQKAATQLNAEVQTKVGRYDVSDVALMQQAFSPDAPQLDRPRLRWPGKDDDLTVKAMRFGILNVAQGVYSAIRNPAIHGTGELPRQVAFEQLATLSTLARWIDECELVKL